jgi:hypothetical protein
MAQEVNRFLQDKINLLSKQELEELGQSYIGKYAIVLYDSRFIVSKVVSLPRNIYPNGLDYNDDIRDRKKGDKTIIFKLENGEDWELVDIAKVGDSIIVREQNDNLYLNHTITFLDDKSMSISDGRSFSIPISRKSFRTPMLMNIGWFDTTSATSPRQTTLPHPPNELKVDDLMYFNDSEKKVFVITYVPYPKFEYKVNYKGNVSTDLIANSKLINSIDSGEIVNLVSFQVGDEFRQIEDNIALFIDKVEGDIVRYTEIDLDTAQPIRSEKFTRNRLIAKLLQRDFRFQKRVDTSNIDVDTTPMQDEKVQDKTLNLEGDFIAEFLNKNATELLELESNNRPLFDVVEMTLNLLNQKFGKGDDIGEKVEDVIVHSEEIINEIKQTNPDLIGLKEIKVEYNEGSVDLKGSVFTTWTDFTNALKPLYDTSISGYNKVKFKATFDDGKYIIDRVDVGQNDFNPETMKVGEYVDRPFSFFDNLDDDLDKYQWDDVIVVTESGEEDAISKDDVENEIKSLEIALMFEEDQDKIDEINQKIEALKTSLLLI